MGIYPILSLITPVLAARAESTNKSTPAKAAPPPVDTVSVTPKLTKDQLDKEVLYALSISSKLFKQQSNNALKMAGGLMALICASMIAYPALTGLALIPAVAIGIVFVAFLSLGVYFAVDGGLNAIRTYKETGRQAALVGQRIAKYDASSREYIINSVKKADQRFGELMEKAANKGVR